MIKYFLLSVTKNFHLLFLRLGLNRKKYENFKDLNFKQSDFINYKNVKHYVLKEKLLQTLLEECRYLRNLFPLNNTYIYVINYSGTQNT